MPAREGIELLAHAVRPANAYEETMQRLLQSIRLGLIRPGERLPAERELSGMLGVSRDTLRDAISTLAEQGFVVSRRGRYGGTFVCDELPGADGGADDDDAAIVAPGAAAPVAVDAAEVEDVVVLRRVLEIGAARQAAGRDLTAKARATLVAALAECRAADDASYRRVDSRLHLIIAELSGSPTLVPLSANMRTRLNALLDSFPVLPPNIEHSDEQHQRIVNAILAGDPESAGEAMREHLEGSEALLRGFLTDTVA